MAFLLPPPPPLLCVGVDYWQPISPPRPGFNAKSEGSKYYYCLKHMEPKEITPLVWGLALVLTSCDDGFVLPCIIVCVSINFISSVRLEALSRLFQGAVFYSFFFVSLRASSSVPSDMAATRYVWPRGTWNLAGGTEKRKTFISI